MYVYIFIYNVVPIKSLPYFMKSYFLCILYTPDYIILFLTSKYFTSELHSQPNNKLTFKDYRKNILGLFNSCATWRSEFPCLVISFHSKVISLVCLCAHLETNSHSFL